MKAIILAALFVGVVCLAIYALQTHPAICLPSGQCLGDGLGIGHLFDTLMP